MIETNLNGILNMIIILIKQLQNLIMVLSVLKIMIMKCGQFLSKKKNLYYSHSITSLMNWKKN